MPSMPTVNRMPHDGIQAGSTTDCHPAFAGSTLHQSPSETTNSATNVSSASRAGGRPRADATSSSPGSGALGDAP